MLEIVDVGVRKDEDSIVIGVGEIVAENPDIRQCRQQQKNSQWPRPGEKVGHSRGKVRRRCGGRLDSGSINDGCFMRHTSKVTPGPQNTQNWARIAAAVCAAIRGEPMARRYAACFGVSEARHT